MKGTTLEYIMALGGIILVALLLSFLLSYPLMLLWNATLVPAVAVLSEVSWLQMWGIAALVQVLFNGISITKK
jgi:hypothetical protein